MFLTLDDYTPIISTQELQAIIQSDDNNRLKAEKMALAKIQKYLQRQYDTDVIFAQTGDDRDATLVEYAIYYTLYILYGSIAKMQVPDDRYEQYKEAKAFFMAIKNNEIDTDLPRKLDTEGAETSPAIKMSSQPPSSHYY